MKRTRLRIWEWLISAAILGVLALILAPIVPFEQVPARLGYSLFGSRASARSLVLAANRSSIDFTMCGNERMHGLSAWTFVCRFPIDDPETTRGLLADSNPKVRSTIALAIGNARQARYLSELQRLASTDPDRHVRACSVSSLGELSDRSSVSVLKAAERDPSPAVRAVASHSLVNMGLEADVKQLKRLCDAETADNSDDAREARSAHNEAHQTLAELARRGQSATPN